MSNLELRQKLMDMSKRRAVLTRDLVAPAKAAANQMLDAGMKRGAEPIAAIVFEIEAIDQEIEAMAKDPATRLQVLDELLKMAGGG